MRTAGRERREALSYAERNIAYFTFYTGLYVVDYKVGFTPSIVEDGQPRAVSVYFDERKIEISASEYDRVSRRKDTTKHFPDLYTQYLADRILTNRYLANLDMSPLDALDIIKKGSKKIDGDTYTVRYAESRAKADAMSKLIPIISLYDASGRRDWRKFSETQIFSMLRSDIGWLAWKEKEMELKHTRVGDEVRRAREEYASTRGFREFTLRFMDSLYMRSREEETQYELLGDIFALTYLRAHRRKAELGEVITSFFDEQRSKQIPLELASTVRKAPRMLAVESERDKYLKHITIALRKSKRLPPLAGDFSKEWSEN